jgi:hypothetical protein
MQISDDEHKSQILPKKTRTMVGAALTKAASTMEEKIASVGVICIFNNGL